jgi:hypothetical protein
MLELATWTLVVAIREPLLVRVAEIDCEVVMFDPMAWLLTLLGAGRPRGNIVEVGLERVVFLCRCEF